MDVAGTVVGNAQAMLTEVVKAMCKRPELLRVDFEEHGETILVKTWAHPNDSRIIVGSEASHLKAIVKLARLLFAGSHKIVHVLPVNEVPGHKREDYRKFKPSALWPEDKMKDLARRLALSIFDRVDVEVRCKVENRVSSLLDVIITGEVDEHSFKRFSSAISVLFIPIGTNYGRMLYATAKRKN
jgi:hypothetical protein